MTPPLPRSSWPRTNTAARAAQPRPASPPCAAPSQGKRKNTSELFADGTAGSCLVAAGGVSGGGGRLNWAERKWRARGAHLSVKSAAASARVASGLLPSLALRAGGTPVRSTACSWPNLPSGGCAPHPPRCRACFDPSAASAALKRDTKQRVKHSSRVVRVRNAGAGQGRVACREHSPLDDGCNFRRPVLHVRRRYFEASHLSQALHVRRGQRGATTAGGRYAR